MDNYKKETLLNINYFFNNLDLDCYQKFIDIIIKHQNDNIYLLGVGKSHNICNQFADLLKCINFNVFSLKTSSLLHGDIGLIKSNDLVIMISNSGNTNELVNIIKVIVNRNTNITLLSSKRNNTLSKYSKYNFIIPVKNELSFCFSSIPTSSVINYLLFVNYITSCIIKKMNLSKNIFIENHTSGNIGKINKKVKEFTIPANKCCILDIKSTIKQTIIKMNSSKFGCGLVENNSKIIGMITDRDIRNYLENNDDLNVSINEIINRNFYYINDDNLLVSDINKLYTYIPIIKNNEFIGLFSLSHNIS